MRLSHFSFTGSTMTSHVERTVQEREVGRKAGVGGWWGLMGVPNVLQVAGTSWRLTQEVPEEALNLQVQKTRWWLGGEHGHLVVTTLSLTRLPVTCRHRCHDVLIVTSLSYEWRWQIRRNLKITLSGSRDEKKSKTEVELTPRIQEGFSWQRDISAPSGSGKFEIKL